MTQKFLAILLSFILALTTITFTACNGSENGSSTNNSQNENVHNSVYVVNTTENNFYLATSQSAILEDKFTDGVFNYYYYNIGTIKNVPLVYSTTKYHAGDNIDYKFSDSISSQTQESIEESLSNSITESSSSSQNWEKGVEIEVGAEFIVSASTTGKVSYAENWEKSVSNTSEISYSVAESWAVSHTSNIEMSFNSNTPVGYYRYVQYAKETHVFVLIVYNIEEETFSWTYLQYTDTDNTNKVEMIEYSENGNFHIDNTTQLIFDESIINSIDLNENLTNKAPAEPTEITPIAVPVVRINCKHDTSYDLEEAGNSTDGEKDHSGYEIGHIVIYGCEKIGDTYIIRDSKGFKIEYVFEKDTSAKLKSYAKLYSDTATTVKGTDINGEEIGKGAYGIRVKYTDGTSANAIVARDFMNNKGVGSVVDMLGTHQSSLNLNKIATIEITIVYELHWFNTIFDEHYTNWRSDYTFVFNNLVA